MTTITADQTADVLASMLTENTGRHMLDSGGAYGRNWERNQGQTVESFMARTPTRVDVRHGYIDVTIDVFHFLRSCLEYDADVDALFDEFIADREDTYWLQDMEEFPEWLAQNRAEDYGDEPTTMTVNTYNGEDAVSQTLQYTQFSMDGGDACYGEYVLLQIHGGCDVRGGYTRPRAFRTNSEMGLFDNARLDAWCDAPAPPQDTQLPTLEAGREQYYRWTSYNAGYSWEEDSWPASAGDLKDLEWVEAETEADIKPGQLTVWEDKLYGPLGTELHFGSQADYA